MPEQRPAPTPALDPVIATPREFPVVAPVDAVPNRRQGVYAGGYGATLPYDVQPGRPAAGTPPSTGEPLPVGPLGAPTDRSGPLTLAAGLLLLATTAHIHRVLRRPAAAGPTTEATA
jgi:hypothetical protein